MRKWIEIIGSILFGAATVFGTLASVTQGRIFLAVAFVECFLFNLISLGIALKWKPPYLSRLSKKSVRVELVIHSLGFILSAIDCYIATNWLIAASDICFLIYFGMWIVENVIELRRK